MINSSLKIIKNPQETNDFFPSVPYLSTIQSDALSFLRVQIMLLSTSNKTTCIKCNKDGFGIKITSSYLEEREIYFCSDCISHFFKKMNTLTLNVRAEFFRFLDTNCEHHLASIYYHKNFTTTCCVKKCAMCSISGAPGVFIKSGYVGIKCILMCGDCLCRYTKEFECVKKYPDKIDIIESSPLVNYHNPFNFSNWNQERHSLFPSVFNQKVIILLMILLRLRRDKKIIIDKNVAFLILRKSFC